MLDTVLSDAASEGVRAITINRPSRRNALDLATYTALHDALEAADRAPSVRVIILSGAEGCFTSGNDLADFQTATLDEESPAVRFLHALTRLTKPLIAAVEGFAVGIGTTMLLHCDLVYAGRGASFRLPFVPLGLCPEGGSSYLLPRLAGAKQAAALLFFGEAFTAAAAREYGLVNEVTEDGEALALALRQAAALARLPAEAVRTTKALLRRADADAVRDAISVESARFAALRASPEAQAAFAAFFARP
jgi:enoyl-CoA hydratase/carnithine racemase